MATVKTWIGAARLRTLPLSISGILVGSSIAAARDDFHAIIFSLALATTLGLQILSNFANDYGDFVKGTDNEDRVGPQRALQSGGISRKEMLLGIFATAILTFFLALTLVIISFGTRNAWYVLLFLFLGIAAIAAAVYYTVGKKAYGYRGLGDVFVFIFFGVVGVFGSYFLYTLDWDWKVLLPAFSVGFLSTGVLNLNNMRDRRADEKAGKITLAVKMGAKGAKNYHYSLIMLASLSLVVFTVLTFTAWDDYLYFISFFPLFQHLNRVFKNENPELLDPELKKLALSTFLLAILFAIGQVL